MSSAIFPFFVMPAIFASIFIISQVLLNTLWTRGAHKRAINARLSLIRQGIDHEKIAVMLHKNRPVAIPGLPSFLNRMAMSLQQVVAASNTRFSTWQVLVAMGLLVVVVFFGLLVFIGTTDVELTPGVALLIVVVAICVGLLLPLFVLSALANRRRRRVEQQFPVALDVFVRALRAGHPIASALSILTIEMEDPIGSEFGMVTDEVSYGADLTDALGEMAERWDSDDIRMFVVSLSVQSETGGNLAEILQNLSDVIRARASLFLKVRALSSEGRMTGWLLTALPIFAFVGMFMVNPGFYLSVAQERSFIIGFICLIALYIVGVLMIRKMVAIKV